MSAAERSRYIEASESRLCRGITGFKNYGMSSLLEPDEVERHPHFPLRPFQVRGERIRRTEDGGCGSRQKSRSTWGRLPRIGAIRRGRGRERGHLKASVDTNLQVAYFTSALINQKVCEYADGHSRQHVCGPRGSYPARDPGAPRFEGRGVRQRAGRALRDELASGLQTPQGAGACRPDLARPRGAVAALPVGGGSAEGGRRLGGAISPFLGAELRSLGRLSARATEGRERRWRTMMIPTRSRRSRSLSSRACSTLRASSCSRHGRSLSTSCAGVVRRATLRPSPPSIFALVASCTTACGRPRDARSGARAYFARSWCPSGSSSPIPSRMPKATWSRLRITG